MIKGCQREMIVLQTGESELFESAYFILRRKKTRPLQTDMVAEANRIIAFGSCLHRSKKVKKRGWLLFLCGAALGAAACALIVLLF